MTPLELLIVAALLVVVVGVPALIGAVVWSARRRTAERDELTALRAQARGTNVS